jgi:hypothetical protein
MCIARGGFRSMATRPFVGASLFLASAFLLASVTSAQTASKPALKFDEFGDILYSEMIAHLDNFAVQLENQPETHGFVVVYRTRRDLPGLNHKLALRMKSYLVERRNIPRERLAIVDGGIAEHLIQELWIVPPGTAPTPRSDARIGYLEPHDSAWKFDEYWFWPGGLDRLKRDAEPEAEYLEAYASEVQKRSDQVACIIVYAQYNRHPPLVDFGEYEPQRDARLDPRNTARQRAEHEKSYLVSVYGIPASRIQTIDGGYRKARLVELWIVPAGEPLPIATPNSFPPKRKRIRS